MIDRDDICRRHSLAPHIASELHGETEAELEADAAARASIAQMFGGDVEAEPVEPPPQRLEALSDDELAARQQAVQDEKARRAERIEETRFADDLAHSMTKPSDVAIIDALHGGEEE